MRKLNTAPYPLYSSYLKADAASLPCQEGRHLQNASRQRTDCSLTQLLGPHGMRLSLEGRRSLLLPSEGHGKEQGTQKEEGDKWG